MAVYTEVSDDDLAEFIASYKLGGLLSYKGIAEGVENTNYLVHTEKGPYFLTIYEKRVAPADLPFFLGLMEHLAKAGINCPTPVRDAEGRMLRELAGKPAALVTFLEGVWIRRPQARHCWAMGQAMATAASSGPELRAQQGQCAGNCRLASAVCHLCSRAEEVAPGLGATIEQELDSSRSQLAGRPAAGHHPCRSVSRQRLLPRRHAVGIDRLLLRLQRRLAYDIAVGAQRLVLRDRPLLQRHQGPGAAQRLSERARR